MKLQLAGAITERTRAIVPVHYAGVGCEMTRILELARARGIAVVEDNAHGLFASMPASLLGTFGCLATQSFHETKNMSCGEGGALLINDPALAERAGVSARTDRSRFFRGQVDRTPGWTSAQALPAFRHPGWLFAGPTGNGDPDSGTALARLAHVRRRAREWAREHEVRTPFVPDVCEQAYHMYYLLMRFARSADALRAFLKSRGIMAVFHYLPLNLSDMGLRFGGYAGQCPVTEDLSDRLVRLPFYNSLLESEQSDVIESIRQFDGWQAS